MLNYSVRPDEVLKRYKVIAVVGASKNPDKDANTVPTYLMEHGYTVIPVNPTADTIHGLKVYPSLADLPADMARTVDVVDVFRPSEELPGIARQVILMKQKTSRPFVFWAQQGLVNDEAKVMLGDAHIDYVMDACLRTEHKILGRSLVSLQGRINGEWHAAHPMPENPTEAQRVRWHFEHAEACGCRPVPEGIADQVRAMITAAGADSGPN